MHTGELTAFEAALEILTEGGMADRSPVRSLGTGRRVHRIGAARIRDRMACGRRVRPPESGGVIVDRVIVAYRHKSGKRYTGLDREIVCASCRSEGDREIVARSENGERIKYGVVDCGACGNKIKP